jgi:hypothetical protein
MTNPPENHNAQHAQSIIEKELSYSIVGAGFEVYNELGYGFPETVYSRALEIVLRSKGFLVEREVHFKVPFRGHIVGQGRMDMLVREARHRGEQGDRATPRDDAPADAELSDRNEASTRDHSPLRTQVPELPRTRAMDLLIALGVIRPIRPIRPIRSIRWFCGT